LPEDVDRVLKVREGAWLLLWHFLAREIGQFILELQKVVMIEVVLEDLEQLGVFILLEGLLEDLAALTLTEVGVVGHFKDLCHLVFEGASPCQVAVALLRVAVASILDQLLLNDLLQLLSQLLHVTVFAELLESIAIGRATRSAKLVHDTDVIVGEVLLVKRLKHLLARAHDVAQKVARVAILLERSK